MPQLLGDAAVPTFHHALHSFLFLQLAPGLNFFLNCLGLSYLMWNPIIFALLDDRFRSSGKSFVNEEVNETIEVNFIMKSVAMTPDPLPTSPWRWGPPLLLVVCG